MAEARSQQAASMTEFHWLGNRFPISNAKTRVSILKGMFTLCKRLHFEKRTNSQLTGASTLGIFLSLEFGIVPVYYFEPNFVPSTLF